MERRDGPSSVSPGLVTNTLRMSSASLLVSSSIPSMPRLGEILNIDFDQLLDVNTIYIFWKDSKIAPSDLNNVLS